MYDFLSVLNRLKLCNRFFLEKKAVKDTIILARSKRYSSKHVINASGKAWVSFLCENVKCLVKMLVLMILLYTAL